MFISILHIYFVVNMIYTLILIVFFHNLISKKIEESLNRKPFDLNVSKSTVISITTNLLYVAYIFVGSIFLINDFLQMFINRKECLWLSGIYGDKDEKK